MSSSLEWQMLSLNTIHKHPKPTAASSSPHCLPRRLLTACRQISWLTEVEKSPAGRLAVNPSPPPTDRPPRRAPAEDVDSIHTRRPRFSCFIWSSLESLGPGRVPELKPEPNKNSKFWQLRRFRRWKMSEPRPFMGRCTRSLSLDWAAMKSDLIEN